MYVQTGKTFIATLIAVVLALGGIAWFSSGGHKGEPAALAQSNSATQAPPQQADSASEASGNAAATPTGQSYEDGYRTGYRDGHQDCATTQTEYVPSRGYSAPRYSRPRVRVAGERYYAEPRRGHSKRNLFLTIAGPAAIGAGIGAIARGGKGAGIGALLGGGGGALYYLVKHRHE
jgi:hypothetical protein